MLRSRVASGGGVDESTYDPTIPPERQIVTYKTKDGEIKKVTKLELQDQLQASEKLMEGLNLTWEQKMAKTQAIQVEREKALEDLGIMVDKDVSFVRLVSDHELKRSSSVYMLLRSTRPWSILMKVSCSRVRYAEADHRPAHV